MTHQQIAKLINDCLISDSDITIPVDDILRAFAKDKAVPTKQEVPPFVMGDDDGMVPKHLAEKYPHLHKLLNEYF